MTIVVPLGLWLVTLDGVFHGFSQTEATYVYTKHVLSVGFTLLEYVSCHCFVVKLVFKSDGDDCLFGVWDIQSLIWGEGEEKSNKAEKEFESYFDFVLQQIVHL